MLRSMLVLLSTFCLLITPALAQDIPRPLASLTFSSKSVLSFSPDASHLAIWEPTGSLRLYDLQNFYAPLSTTQVSAAYVKRMWWSSDYTSLLLIASQNLYIMNATTGDLQPIVNNLDEDQYIAARFFQDDHFIVAETGRDIGSALVDLQTYVWDATTLQLVLHLPAVEDCPAELPTNPFAVQVIKFMRSGFLQCPRHAEWNPDQSQYLTWAFWNSSEATTIKIYDTATRQLTTELSHYSAYSTADKPLLADLGEVSWSPDGSKIVSVPQYGRDKINIWDAATGKLLVSLSPIAGKDTDGLGAWDFAPVFSEDGKQIMTAGSSGYIFVWDVASGTLIHQWHYTDYSVTGAKWIYGNKLVVGWGLVEIFSTKGASIWDAATGDLRALLPVESDPKDVIENTHLNLMLLVTGTSIDIYDLAQLAAH